MVRVPEALEKVNGVLSAPAFLIPALILLGTALRLVPLVGNPLHQDEALYGFWGRLASSGRDPWLATAAVDKPPLVLYLVAGSQAVFGSSAFAVRLPGLAASLLTIPLVYVLGHRLYADCVTASVAAAAMALSPFPVLFGATGFTDPMLVACWVAACYCALSGRWGWAGLLSGLAFASKQHALVLALLVIGLGLIGWRWFSGRGRWRASAARFVLALVAVLAVVFAWDAIRVARGARAGFWDQGVDSFGGLRLIWPTELVPRWQAWARLGGYLLGWSWLGGLLLLGIGGFLWRDLTGQRQTRAAVADLALFAFCLFYLFLHWLLAFPVWDRYLLPMVPIMALLMGRVVSLMPSALRNATNRWRALHSAKLGTYRPARNNPLVFRFALYASLAVLLLSTGLAAASGRVPVGGDHGAYDGLEEVVGFLRGLPVGRVLYDRWLSWHYDFYLFDAYLYRAGFPTPEWLATDAANFYDGRSRYLVLPSWESPARLARALSEVGLTMSPVFTTQRRDGTTSFVVYEIGSE